MEQRLLVGVAEIDITPPVGTLMAGDLTPRPSKGISDPLMAKAIVFASSETRKVYVICDLCGLDRATNEDIAVQASALTGIPAGHIVVSCSHTHSGPCTIPSLFPESTPDPVDHAWLNTTVARIARCVQQADAGKAPAHIFRTRGYQHDVSHNRRVHYKDGRAINTWLLNNGEEDMQAVGAAGPIDPEVGIICVEDDAGTLRAVLFNFALHANAHFGPTFSGDYPAVVAARLRERYGPQVITLYMPGACGDLNPIRSYRDIGNGLADTIIARLAHKVPLSPTLGIRHATLDVPARDVHADQEDRILASQWSPDAQEFFRATQRDLQRQDVRSLNAPLFAWHIGEVSFATFPGEAFVELGLRMKRESPFPWVYPVELTGDCLDYLITPTAWDAGGYESLVATTGIVHPDGSRMMCDRLLEMQQELVLGAPAGSANLPIGQ